MSDVQYTCHTRCKYDLLCLSGRSADTGSPRLNDVRKACLSMSGAIDHGLLHEYLQTVVSTAGPVGGTTADDAAHDGENQCETSTDDQSNLRRDQHGVAVVNGKTEPTTTRHATVQSSVRPSKQLLFCSSTHTKITKVASAIASTALHNTSTC